MSFSTQNAMEENLECPTNNFHDNNDNEMFSTNEHSTTVPTRTAMTTATTIKISPPSPNGPSRTSQNPNFFDDAPTTPNRSPANTSFVDGSSLFCPYDTTFETSNDSPPHTPLFSSWHVDAEGIHVVLSPDSLSKPLDTRCHHHEDSEKHKDDKSASPSSVATQLSSSHTLCHAAASDCGSVASSYWDMAGNTARISVKGVEVARLRKLLKGRRTLKQNNRLDGSLFHTQDSTMVAGAASTSTEDSTVSANNMTKTTSSSVPIAATTTTATSEDKQERAIHTPSTRLVSTRGQILLKKRIANLRGNPRFGTNKISDGVNSKETLNDANKEEFDGNGANVVSGGDVAANDCEDNHGGSDIGENHLESGLARSRHCASNHEEEGNIIQSASSPQSHSSPTNSSSNRKAIQEYFQQSNPSTKSSKSILFHKMFSKKKKLSTLMTTSNAIPLGTRSGLSGISPKKKKFPTISELCAAILPIQTLARQYLAKRAVDRRKRSIVIVQSVLRTWRTRRDYKIVLARVTKIQSLHRGNVDRCEFHTLRSMFNIAIAMQKCHRGITVRKVLAQQHLAATLIESQTRRYTAQRQYRSILRGIIAFQSLARMHPHQKRFQKEMIAKRTSLFNRCATQIQSAYRGYTQRLVYQHLMMENEKATVIQSKWRAFCQRSKYVKIVRDVVIVQCEVRRSLGVRRSQVKRKERNAAVLIQSRVRSYRAENAYLWMFGCIVVSQCVVRRWMARCRVEKKRIEKRKREENEGGRTIQAMWRGCVVRRKFLATVGDLILCQSVARRFLSVRRVEKIRYHECCSTAAIIIQSICRTWAASQDYIKTISGIIVAQSVIRRWIACRHVIRLREDLRLRQEYLASVSAATVIVSCWKRFKCESEYRKVVTDVIFCQSAVRRFIAAAQAGKMRHERSMVAATKIQAMWRCYITKELYYLTVMDVAIIQSIARRLLSMRILAQLKEEKRSLEEAAAVTIESMWRGYVCLSEYKESLRDIIICQSVARRNIAASQAARLRKDQCIASAIMIQATWRARVARDVYILTLFDILTVQSLARKIVAQRMLGRLKEEKYLVEVRSATMISSSWRRFVCLRAYRRTIADIIVCQSVFRRNMALKEAEGLLFVKHVEACASFIQEIWRAYVARERILRVLSNMEKSKLVEVKSATNVSKYWRRFSSRRKYLSIIRNVKLCQTVVRRHLAIKKVLCQRMLYNVAATVIQTMWRASAASHECYRTSAGEALQSMDRKSISTRHAVHGQVEKRSNEVRLAEVIAATKIATLWRRFHCQTQFASKQKCEKSRLKMSIVSISNIQSACRGHAGLNKVTCTVSSVGSLNGSLEVLNLYGQFTEEMWLLQESAASKLAAFWRCYTCSRAYKRALRDVVLCQSFARCKIACKKTDKLKYERPVTCAMVVESVWREQQSKSQLTDEVNYCPKFANTLTIKNPVSQLTHDPCSQRHLHHLKSKNDLNFVDAATRITTSWRGYRCRSEFQQTVKDVLVCQSAARRIIGIRSFQSMRHNYTVTSAIRIQTTWRGYSARQKAALSISSVLVLQTMARLWLDKIQFNSKKEHEAATKIRSSWLAFYWRRIYNHVVTSATLIQATWRCHSAWRKSAHSLSSIYLCPLKACRWLHKYQLPSTKDSAVKKQEAATKIQASWLAFKWHKKFILTISDVILCQAIARRFIASKWSKVQQSISGQSASEKIFSISIPFETVRHKLKASSPSDPMLSHPPVSERQYIMRKMIATNKIEQLLKGKIQKHQEAATKIQTAYRRHYYRTKMLLALRVIVTCQSALRMRRAIRLAEELRFFKKLGPKDIFNFIKKRKDASATIRTAYQDYATRNFEQSYNNYLMRLHQAAENMSSNELLPQDTEETPSSTFPLHQPAVQCSKITGRNQDSDVYNLVHEESPKGSPAQETARSTTFVTVSTISEWNGAISEAESDPSHTSYALEEDVNLESHCWERSRCGLSDEVHDMLIQSGKWFYDRLGDPGDDTAEDLLTVMEISEEAAFCCWKKATTERAAKSGAELTIRENNDEFLSAIAIQSLWRSYSASKHFSKMRRQCVFDECNIEDNSCAASGKGDEHTRAVENAMLCQSFVSKHTSRIPRRSTKFDDTVAESAISRCQQVVRRLIKSRNSKELVSTQQAYIAHNSYSPARKHVAKTGQIEIMLNDGMDEDATLTDYSETESSDEEKLGDLMEDEPTDLLEMIVTGDVPTTSRSHILTSDHEEESACYIANSSEVDLCHDGFNHIKIPSTHDAFAEANNSKYLLTSETSNELERIYSRGDITNLTEFSVTKSRSISLPDVRESIIKEKLDFNLSDVSEINLPPAIFRLAPHRNLGDTMTEDVRYGTDITDTASTQINNSAILAPEMEDANLTLNQPKGDDLSYASDLSNDIGFQSKCFDHSRCGLSDNLHALLIESGKWIHDRVGDPGEETAENLVTAMEIGEEAAFFFWSPVPREIN